MAPSATNLVLIGDQMQLSQPTQGTHPGDSGIIYCSSRRRTDELAEFLRAERVKALAYHAGMEAADRTRHRLVIGEGIRLAIIGIVLGALGAALVTRAMTSLLYGVKPFDPALFAALSAGLTVVVIFACYIPARRATKVDPLAALRYE